MTMLHTEDLYAICKEKKASYRTALAKAKMMDGTDRNGLEAADDPRLPAPRGH